LPRSLWGEAVHHVIWLLNQTITKAIDGVTLYKAENEALLEKSAGMGRDGLG
jgi:hypothetical protein